MPHFDQIQVPSPTRVTPWSGRSSKLFILVALMCVLLRRDFRGGYRFCELLAGLVKHEREVPQMLRSCRQFRLLDFEMRC